MTRAVRHLDHMQSSKCGCACIGNMEISGLQELYMGSYLANMDHTHAEIPAQTQTNAYCSSVV